MCTVVFKKTLMKLKWQDCIFVIICNQIRLEVLLLIIMLMSIGRIDEGVLWMNESTRCIMDMLTSQDKSNSWIKKKILAAWLGVMKILKIGKLDKCKNTMMDQLSIGLHKGKGWTDIGWRYRLSNYISVFKEKWVDKKKLLFLEYMWNFVDCQKSKTLMPCWSELKTNLRWYVCWRMLSKVYFISV